MSKTKVDYDYCHKCKAKTGYWESDKCYIEIPHKCKMKKKIVKSCNNCLYRCFDESFNYCEKENRLIGRNGICKSWKPKSKGIEVELEKNRTTGRLYITYNPDLEKQVKLSETRKAKLIFE